MEKVPKTNIFRWKNEPDNKYCTIGLNLEGMQEYELLNSFANDRKARAVFTSYVLLVKLLLHITHGLNGFRKMLKENSFQVVSTIQKVRGTVGIKRALKFFNISIYTFRQWAAASHTSCFQSATGSCNRIYPLQVSRPEVITIKHMLLDPRYQYWPISSIAHDAMKKNLLSLSINPWYKYAAKLGVARPKPCSRRKIRTEGIRTEKPNQLWHADITEFVAADGDKFFIYLVADNFSRKILSMGIE